MNSLGSTNPVPTNELPLVTQVQKNRNQLFDRAGDTSNGTAIPKIDNADDNLRLLNLNFINNETFFNFSCYESGQQESVVKFGKGGKTSRDPDASRI